MMGFELVRLLFGFMIALFHRPISDFVMERERVLITAFRDRGIPAPELTEEGARNVYFALGIFIMLLEMGRIWGLTHPTTAWHMLVNQ
jgi:hypothetical protein